MQGNYHRSIPNWREQLRTNDRKTKWVVATFIGLYVLLGLLIDLFLAGERYYLTSYANLLLAFLTLQLIPYATIITSAIAIISLWIAYSRYDRIMLLGTQYRQISADSKDPVEQQLYNVVEEMKVAAGLNYMPKVYLIEADYMNAFASGYSEKSAMVAITRGLLTKLKRDELQAVMAHEISHIRHHDIKLTLMVTVLSNLMLIVVDILFYSVLFSPRRRQDGNKLVIVILLLRYLLPFITILLGLYLSRTREYMADAGCVELTRDNEPLARALMKISGDHQENAAAYKTVYQQTAHEEVRRAAYIFDPVKAGFGPTNLLSSAFSTHPKLADRLAALGFKKRES